jgi:hypothetical protein
MASKARSRFAAAVLADLPPSVWTKAPLVEAEAEAELLAAILGYTLDPQSPLTDGLRASVSLGSSIS